MLAASALVVCPAPGQAACVMSKAVSVPLRLSRGLPVVDVRVDGTALPFVLDTGAERTLLSAAAVRALRQPRDRWVSSSVRGVGGVLERSANAAPQSFSLGNLKLRRNALDRELSLVVAPLPVASVDGRVLGGLLGGDYLSAYDLDLDIAGGTLVLYRVSGCAAAPWIAGAASVPLSRPKPYVLLAPVEVDGRTLSAEVDTGSSVSLITARGAAILGVGDEAPTAGADGSARGVGRQVLSIRSMRAGTVRIGKLSLTGLLLPVGSPAGGFPFDMLLGADLLSARRVLISYATGQLLIAPLTPP